MDFNECYAIVLKYEGGYVNNPADKGGETNYGVTQDTYDKYRDKMHAPRQSVRFLMDTECKEIYNGYWKSASCAKIAITHPLTAFVHFDFAINAGSAQAARTLQRTVSAEPVDGILGRISFSAIFSRNDKEIAIKYLDNRILFYKYLIEKDPTQEVFRKNWMKRIELIRGIVNDKSASNKITSSNSAGLKCATCGQPIPSERIQ